MVRVAMFLFLGVLLAAPAAAQDVQLPQLETAVSAEARFVVLPSPSTYRRALRLDRWTGEVRELVIDDGKPVWVRCEIEGMPEVVANRPRFQLLTNGRDGADRYLLDTETGATWSSEPAAAYRVGHRNFFKTIWKPMAIEGGGIH